MQKAFEQIIESFYIKSVFRHNEIYTLNSWCEYKGLFWKKESKEVEKAADIFLKIEGFLE